MITNKLLSSLMIMLVVATAVIFFIQVLIFERGILQISENLFALQPNSSNKLQENISPKEAHDSSIRGKSNLKTQTHITKQQARGGGVKFTDEMAQKFNSEYINHTSHYCLTEKCIAEEAKGLARAFPDRPNKEEWCIPKGINSNSTINIKRHQGLILVKIPKAASSTAAGVVLRLGHRHDCDLDYIHWEHMHAHKEYAYRDTSKSFMLSSVRDPAKQLASFVFWTHVSQTNIPMEDVGDAYLISKFVYHGSNLGHTQHFQGGLQTQFAALEEIPRGVAWDPEAKDLINPHDTVGRVKKIMDNYDFILVSERMDESLVVLSLLLDVPVGDVLVTSSKVSAPTKVENGQGKQQTSYVYVERVKECYPMRSPKLTPLIKGYLESDFYRSQVYGDLILNAAANKSLDLTIERLGRERFQKAMEDYRYWKQREKKECATKVQFPCSRDAVPQLEIAKANCYERDFGCGHQCVDEMLAKGKESGWWFW